jgi:ABC-type transporter Mla MlaB component
MTQQFTIKKMKAGGMHLILKGDLTVQHCQALKENLKTLLAARGEVKISMQAIQSIDVTTVQLLSAFRKNLTGVSLEIIWPEGPINELITKTGIKQLLEP